MIVELVPDLILSLALVFPLVPLLSTPDLFVRFRFFDDDDCKFLSVRLDPCNLEPALGVSTLGLAGTVEVGFVRAGFWRFD